MWLWMCGCRRGGNTSTTHHRPPPPVRQYAQCGHLSTDTDTDSGYGCRDHPLCPPRAACGSSGRTPKSVTRSVPPQLNPAPPPSLPAIAEWPTDRHGNRPTAGLLPLLQQLVGRPVAWWCCTDSHMMTPMMTQ
ncbi:hypothetical protein PLESTM_000724700 [Pleodorina starrii]|nr:hypothetical protein PLESTM_000724700 [Pleodorina starrii]